MKTKILKKIITIVFFTLLISPSQTFAARLWSSGIELGSVTEDVEFNVWVAAGAIDTATVRTGTNSFKVALTGSSSRRGGYVIPNPYGSAHSFYRAYVRFETFPTAANTFMATGNSDSTKQVFVKIDNAGQLSLVDEDGSIGTGSTLSLHTWYRLELEVDTSTVAGSHVVNLYLNGNLDVGSSARNISLLQEQFYFVGNGNSEGHSTGVWYFDDIAINDSSGSAQTGLPGAGGILHMQPDGAGDAAATAGLFSAIDEVTPNDATDYIEVDTDTGGQQANYNFESWANAGGASNDSITLVQVGTRQTMETAVAGAWTPQIKSQSGGTTASGDSTSQDDSTWQTNQDSGINRTYRLTSYVDPQAGGAWTPSLLDTMIAGVNVTDGNPDNWFSTIWTLVEFTPPSSTYPIAATGGTITESGGYKYHAFTGSGTFQVTSGSGNIEVLVVGGGAGGGTGGTASRGGGGAGGIVYNSSYAVSVNSYTVTVGAGSAGAASTGVASSNGSNSVFDTLTALGGGGAGIHLGIGKDGGSGGGGSGWSNTAGGSGLQPGSASGGFGNNGGAAMGGTSGGASGGGGGAGAVGTTGVSGQGGAGGVGQQYSQFSYTGGSPAGWFGGGGGGGAASGSTAGAGGQGGGGAGGAGAVGGIAIGNTGGGGGGSTSTGGAGGSGVVIVRYAEAVTNPAISLAHYRWRTDNGSEASATYQLAEDTPITANLFVGDRMRLRFSLSNSTASASNYTYLLEHASSTDCSGSTGWLAVPTNTSNNPHWVMDTTVNVADGSATTDSSGLTNPDGKSFVAGFVETQNNQTPALTLTSSQFTELEYSIRSTIYTTIGTTYCFRLTNAGSITNFTYTVQPQASVTNVIVRPSAGGTSLGGEGSGSGSTITGGVFRGGGASALDEGSGSGPIIPGGGPGGGGGDSGFLSPFRFFTRLNLDTEV